MQAEAKGISISGGIAITASRLTSVQCRAREGADMEGTLDRSAVAELGSLEVGVSAQGIEARHRRMAFAQMRKAEPAQRAVATGDGPVEQDRLAGLEIGDPFAAGEHLPGSLVAEHVALAPRQGIPVGVTDPRSLDRDQNFPGAGRSDFDLLESETTLTVGDGGGNVHERRD